VSTREQQTDRVPTEPSGSQQESPAGPEPEGRTFESSPEPYSPQPDKAQSVSGYIPEDWLAEMVTLTVQGRQQMDRVEARLESLTHWPDRLERRLSEAMVETETWRDALEGIQAEIKRIGRQQFKANALEETRGERWQDTIQTLESALSRREGEIATIRLEHRQAVEMARQQWLSALLPVLDGLEDAFAAGNAQMDRLEAGHADRETEQRQRRGLFARFLQPLSHPQDAPDHDVVTSLNAWLDGLRLLRDRMWALLEEGGVRVLPSVGQPFNPHLHIAVGTVDRSDIAAGWVVEERRRGYRVGDRVIRFAEVVVARSPTARETEKDVGNEQSPEEQL
jgi:molecular chaperone GrpE (heat shock protein)